MKRTMNSSPYQFIDGGLEREEFTPSFYTRWTEPAGIGAEAVLNGSPGSPRDAPAYLHEHPELLVSDCYDERVIQLPSHIPEMSASLAGIAGLLGIRAAEADDRWGEVEAIVLSTMAQPLQGLSRSRALVPLKMHQPEKPAYTGSTVEHAA